VLRPPGDDDAHRIAEVCSDPEIARWTNVPSPYTLEDAHAWIALAAIERERGSALNLVALRAADESLVGSVALRLHSDPERHGETGYWVARDARRTGVATRALALIGELAFGELELAWVEIVIAPDNEPSLALARRAGYAPGERQLREFKGELTEFELWRRDAPDI
jgi:RimJ/RimL family protein N-acetyltransferase